MKLNTIKQHTTWNDASSKINLNNAKINDEIEGLKNSVFKNKGYFKTIEALQSTYPNASEGSKAYVGEKFPYYIYLWESDGWVNTNQTGGEETVALGSYYTKEETHEAIEEYHEVISQEEYDALPIKEDKLYFIYEEE